MFIREIVQVCLANVLFPYKSFPSGTVTTTTTFSSFLFLVLNIATGALYKNRQKLC